MVLPTFLRSQLRSLFPPNPGFPYLSYLFGEGAFSIIPLPLFLSLHYSSGSPGEKAPGWP